MVVRRRVRVRVRVRRCIVVRLGLVGGGVEFCCVMWKELYGREECGRGNKDVVRVI